MYVQLLLHMQNQFLKNAMFAEIEKKVNHELISKY